MVSHITDAARVCEFLAYWLGGTTRAEIAALLGYVPRHVTTLIHAGFGRLGRTTVHYDAKRKRWVAPDREDGGLLGPGTSRDAVAVLAAATAWAPEGLSGLSCPIVDTNRFSPHALVRTAYRLHFRGYSLFEDVGRGHYWDLVPSRVLSAEPDLAADYIDASGDEAWHRQVMLHLVLHDHVPPTIAAAIQREHDMLTNRLDIGPLPQALLHYVRAEYLGRRYEGYEAEVWHHFLDPGYDANLPS